MTKKALRPLHPSARFRSHAAAGEPGRPGQLGTSHARLFGKQERAIRDLPLQQVTVGNRVVAMEAKLDEMQDDGRALGANLGPPQGA